MKLLARALFIACCVLLTQTVCAQQDSLKNLLLQYQALDSNRCDIYMKLADAYVRSNTEAAANYADSAITIAQVMQDEKRLAAAYETAGNARWYKSDYYQSIVYTKKAIEIYEKENNVEALGNNYNALGLNYTFLSQYDVALEFTLKALEAAEAEKDSVGSIILLSNIGDLYRQIGDPHKALEYQQQAADLNERFKVPMYYGIIAYCSGFAYQDLKEYDQALVLYDSALVVGEQIGFNELIHRTLNNKSEILSEINRYRLALQTSQQALSVAQMMKSKRGETLSLLNMGKIYCKMKEYAKGEEQFRKALEFSIAGNMDDLSRDTYEALSHMYYKQKNYKQSLDTRKAYEQLKDSIFTIEKSKQIAEAQTLYQTAKKEKENEMLRHQQDVDKATIKQQKTQNIALAAVSIIIIIVGINIYWNRRKLQKAYSLLNDKNNEIHVQNEELKQQAEEIMSQRDFIEAQKDELSLKNKMMTDSIRYAQTIQEALLPFDKKIDDHFPKHGIIYQPKDIVSGDFYWMEQLGDKVLLAVIDCTGHGVPGAFMSIIGLSILNDAVLRNKETDPSKILNYLHQTISKVLKQEHSENHDGMDVALCLIEDEGDQKKLTYSGARRPLYYFEQNSTKLASLKGDKCSIGGANRKAVVEFHNQQIVLGKGARLYLTTDGYVDQHNENGRKFGTLRFEKLLEKLGDQPVNAQIYKLESIMDDFRRDQFQRDDITIVGVEL